MRGGDTAMMRFPTAFEAGIPNVNADDSSAVIVRLSPAPLRTSRRRASSA